MVHYNGFIIGSGLGLRHHNVPYMKDLTKNMDNTTVLLWAHYHIVPVFYDTKMASLQMKNCVRLKNIAKEEIEKCSSELFKVNQTIWNNPEVAYEEKNAHEYLSNFLEEKGFDVTRHFTLDTAFRGVYGHTGVNVGIMCEFDALPGIGHACGHNLIAEAGVGAALGKKN